ncbi:MAG TPA: translocation/assembly module TamB domain-containing protein [Thermoanaerobaculia bacterium]|jgi:translocation and assembly module TamB
MSGEEKRDGRTGTPHEAQRLSAARLLIIVVLFLVLAVYSIWNSDRFQSLFQGVSEARLSELLQRPVNFRRVDFQIFPPSVHLADVRIGNDPRISDEPLLWAEELSIGGGISVTGGELRLGRVRALRPKVSLVQFPDGTWNLPPGLARPAGKGGLQVRVGELVVQQGTFGFNGKAMGLDGRLDDFAAEIFSLPRNRYRGTLACRKAALRLPGVEPLIFGLDLSFRLDPSQGVAVEKLHASGPFGELRAAGEIEDLKNPSVLLLASGEFHIAEVERFLRSSLGFSGDARLRADVRIPPGGAFRITGHLVAAHVDAKGFPVEDLEATVLARPEALVARIEKARYASGEAAGMFRLENLVSNGRPQPMSLALEARGVSLERFFGDLKLPGTGLSGAVSLSASLRWGEAGLEHANGGATLAIEPGPAASILRGRFGVPTAGGGPVTVVDGRVGFNGTPFRFPASAVEMTGGLRIGQWTPDFDFRIRSRDLSELDRIFQNFVAAGGDTPEPLGLAGSGEISGHIAKSWSDPDATVQLAAESARYGGVFFGSVRGSAEMHDGAFFFHPLRVYDGNASVSVEGTVRFRKDPQRSKLDLTLTAKDYPVARFLEYLDLKLPIEGRVTGSFPLVGNPPDAVSGGGVAALDDAVLWGQKVSRVTGRLGLTPGRLDLEDVRADVGGGVIGGRGSLAYKQKTFEMRAAGDDIPIDSLDAAREISSEISGKLSFDVSGSGSVDRPDLTASASLSEARFYGHDIPASLEPRLAVRIVHGDLDGSLSAPGRWTVTAKGDLGASPPELDVGLDVRDLVALMLFTPAGLPAGDGGALAARGRIALPARKGESPSGDFVVTEARLDARDRPGLLRNAGDVRLSLSSGKITLSELHAVGEGVDLRLRGSLDTAGEKPVLDARLSGYADAAVLGLALPDLLLGGRLTLDLATSGAFENPAINGSVRIENGKYRAAGYSFDDIEGNLRLVGSGGEVEGLRAKVGDGDFFAAGTFRLDRKELKDFRFALQGRRVPVRAIPSLRLTVDADLVASGNGTGNQIRGQVTLLRGTYSKDVELTISDLLARTRPTGVTAREAWKEKTALDVRIVSAASLEVRNNLARLSGSVDLTARGTLADPVLLGQILLDEGGRVVFADIRYEIESGTISFSNTARITPFIDLRARAEVKGYDLVVSLVGTWPRITANFTSDPPLSNDAILGLVLSGVPPDTRAQSDTAGQLVSAAGGVVSGAVTGGLTRRTQRIFRLDRFQIDPVFEGSTLSTFRTTIGKQITPDLAVTSSVAIDSSKQPIIRVEWQATDTILVQLIRDENGILSLTFRRRLRF